MPSLLQYFLFISIVLPCCFIKCKFINHLVLNCLLLFIIFVISDTYQSLKSWQRYDTKNLVIRWKKFEWLMCQDTWGVINGTSRTIFAHCIFSCFCSWDFRTTCEILGCLDWYHSSIVLKKLYTTTLDMWQIYQATTELQSYNDLEKFLSMRCVEFQNIEV